MRDESDGIWKLIDLVVFKLFVWHIVFLHVFFQDACCSFKKNESISSRSSSAYSPPELIGMDPNSTLFCVKNKSESNEKQGLPPLVARDSFDMWSLGAVIFYLCTGCELFHSDQRGELEQDNLQALANWDEKTKRDRLKCVSNRFARNLLENLLLKNASSRLTAESALRHPFLVGETPARMVDEDAQFDVYLSYRARSDYLNAQRLYNMLTSRGVRVWWDGKSLPADKEWKDEFALGLLHSNVVVCVLSRDALAPLNSLQHDSEADSLLLECRLALESIELGLCKRMLTVGVGAPDSAGGFSGWNWQWPIDTSVAVVNEIETQLQETLKLACLQPPVRSQEGPRHTLAKVFDGEASFIGGDSANTFEASVSKIAELAFQYRANPHERTSDDVNEATKVLEVQRNLGAIQHATDALQKMMAHHRNSAAQDQERLRSERKAAENKIKELSIILQQFASSSASSSSMG